MLSLESKIQQLEQQFEATPKWFLHKTAGALIPLSGKQILELLVSQDAIIHQVSIVLNSKQRMVRLKLNKADFEEYMVEMKPSEMLEILYG